MAGTVKLFQLVEAVAVQNVTASRHVVQGASVKAIYIEMWILAGGQQPGSITMTVEKLPAGATAPNFTDMATLNSYKNKKNIFYTTQGVTGDANSNPIPFLRQWIKIPKGKQRMGLGDLIIATLSANVEDATHCGLIIYKSYS